MTTRILAAIDHRDAGQATVDFSADLARRLGSVVGVVHVLEYGGRGCACPMESRQDAQLIVERAVFELRMAGIGAEGAVLSAHRTRPSTVLLRASEEWRADAVLVGDNGLSGTGRLAGSGLRQRVLRRSTVPVLVTPASYVDKVRNGRARRRAPQPH